MLPVVVLIGGLGTRLAEITQGKIPKALVTVAGSPFLEWKLTQLEQQGVSEVFLLTQSGAEMIQQFVNERNSKNLKVICIEDGKDLAGTGGAIIRAIEQLPSSFFVTYGDTLLDVSMAEVQEAFVKSNKRSLMTVSENLEYKEPNNTAIKDGLVVSYQKGGSQEVHKFLDYGLLVFKKEVFEDPNLPGVCDLSVVIQKEIEQNQLAAMVAKCDYHDVGTPDALRDTSQIIESLNQTSN